MTTYNSSGLSGTVWTLISTTWYYYNASGNVTRVVTSAEGSEEHGATLFGYAKNGSTVSFVVGETWNGSDVEGTYNITHAREFRYDAARERYLNRQLDPVALQQTGDLVAVEDAWTDYDNDTVYGDFSVDTVSGSLDDKRSYEPGVARFAWQDDGSGTWMPNAASLAFYHGNQIGTTHHMTDASGQVTDDVVYTAFGERIDGTNHRYGYAGAWGYQAHDDFPYLHVGARYYDPASGRFLQQDPIGIRGGLNVYEYVSSSPTSWIDGDGFAKHRARDAKTGRFKKKPWWKKAGKGKGGLAGLCLWLIEREVVPRLDKWIEDDYRKKADKINKPDPRPGPPGGDYPGPPADGSRLA